MPGGRRVKILSLCQVVDEADRLLRQAYQDWLSFVAAAGGAQQAQHSSGRGALKFVASATLTRDPAKIQRLGLHCPRYLALEAADTRCSTLRPPSPETAVSIMGPDQVCPRAPKGLTNPGACPVQHAESSFTRKQSLSWGLKQHQVFF